VSFCSGDSTQGSSNCGIMYVAQNFLHGECPMWARGNAPYPFTSALFHLVLHWLPVQRRVEFKIACLVHQSLASLAPTYLTTDIHLVSEYGRRPLHCSGDRTLTVPRTHNRFGDRSFAVAGLRLWNSLLISLQQISSF